MIALNDTAPAAAAQTCALTAADPLAHWEAAEAAYHLAERLELEALQARRAAAHAVSETIADRAEKSDWPKINADPRVAPLVEAEERAQEAYAVAREQLVLTLAPHWLAFANKFQVVRERADDLLNPLDLTDRIENAGREGDFPGSELAAAIHHAALGAHVGVIKPKFLPQIPAMVAELRAKLESKLDDFTRTGFSALYEDACRLGIAEPPPAAQVPTSRGSAESCYAVWAAEQDRLNGQAADLADNDPRKEELELQAKFYEDLIRNSPCLDRTAALGKLEWLRLAFTVGETGDEERVLDQLREFLERLPGPDGDAELIALGEELERRWADEHRRQGDLSDDELDVVCEHTGEIAAKIDAARAQTVAGYGVKARALAWRLSVFEGPLETVEGCAVAAAQLLNELMGKPHWTPDFELLDLLRQYKVMSREDYLLTGYTVPGRSAVIEARTKILSEGMASIREKARHLRAGTPEALRAKAIFVLDWQPAECTNDFEDEGYRLARSLIADVLGLPSELKDLDRDAFWKAEGFWPATDEEAEAEYAALLEGLGVEATAVTPPKREAA